MQADLNITSEYEVGLRLPNGTEIFPPDTFHGRPVDTPEDRKIILDAIRTSAENLGYTNTEEVVDDFSWVRREKQILTVTRSLDSEHFCLDAPGMLPTSADEVAESVVDAEVVNGESYPGEPVPPREV